MADFSFMGKICFFCGCNKVIKKGLKLGRQRWLCKSCGRLFSSSSRASTAQINDLYSQGNMTVRQIADIFKVNERTVYRHLAKHKPNKEKTRRPGKIIAMMDASYWGWNFGVVAIKDHVSREVVWSKFIDSKERIDDYVEGIKALENEEMKSFAL